MKRICIDARMLFSSGIGTYLQNLLPYFDNHYRLFLLGNESEISRIPLKNAEIIPVSASIYSIKEQLEIPLKAPATDLFWSPHYNTPLLPLRSRKRVVTIHDVFHLKFINTLSFSQKIYAKAVFNAAVKMSDHVITVSHFSKKEILQHLPLKEEKISVIYNGVGEIFLNPKNGLSQKDLIEKYKLPDKYILFVGNLKPHKNIDHLISAFGLLKKDNSWKDYKLVIVGKRRGFIRGINGLDELIQKQGLSSEILFLEKVDTAELPPLYSLASLLVFPSFYEGFGLPPLEAMACECPTLVSDIDCLKEIYQNNSYYISPSEPKSIETGIKEVLGNEVLRKTLIEKGKTYAKKFTWEASANQHLHIFDKVLNK